MLRKIYIYSTPTYLLKGWVKIGETLLQTVLERVKQQDNSSNPEELIILCVIESVYSDKEIHKFLEKKGIKHQRKEWYVFDKGETFVDYTNEAIAVVNEIISNSSQDT